MILYLVKQSLCLAVLLGLYHLIFEREKMHAFNRFYLLGSLGVATCIPFIQTEATSLPAVSTFSQAVIQPTLSIYSTHPISEQKSSFEEWVLFFYGIGSLIVLCRFVRNLLQLRFTITRNQTIPYENARLVLLPEKVIPHTFLQYIFISREAYYNQQIEHELLIHELAHVRQKHSFDVLLMELLQIIFWFNPLMYGYKQAIKLNHEFLADAVVVQSCRNVAAYQRLLLNQTVSQRNARLASHSTFALTKKRFRMMTKTTSPLRASLKPLTLLPVLMLLITTFNANLLAQEPVPKTEKPKTNNSKPANSPKPGEEMYYGNVTMQQAKEMYYQDAYFGFDNGVNINMKQASRNATRKYADLTAEEKANLPDLPPPPVKNVPTQAQLDAWLDPKLYGVWLDGKRIQNHELQNYKPADFGTYSESILTKTAKNYGKHKFQVDVSTKQDFEQFRKEWLARFGITE